MILPAFHVSHPSSLSFDAQIQHIAIPLTGHAGTVPGRVSSLEHGEVETRTIDLGTWVYMCWTNKNHHVYISMSLGQHFRVMKNPRYDIFKHWAMSNDYSQTNLDPNQLPGYARIVFQVLFRNGWKMIELWKLPGSVVENCPIVIANLLRILQRLGNHCLGIS